MHDDSDAGMANSFTDLMTSLMVIFILLLCSFMNNAFQETQDTRTKILKKLQIQLSEFSKEGVKVQTDSNDPLALLILFPESLLNFGTDSSEIPSGGNDFLNSFIPRLTDVIYLPEFRKDISSVVVEGHADSRGSDEHDLGLSQLRSMSVVSKCIKILDSAKDSASNGDDKQNYFLRILSASGRGKRELIFTADGKEDQARSRRVVFKLRVRSFEEKRLEKRI